MLDLNYVRENIGAVRAALDARRFPTDLLNRFDQIDSERRRVIGEADTINQHRNAASKEIGSLMQAGKRDEAQAKKAEVAGLKEKQADLERLRDETESAMREILINLPNIPASDVPVGADESANKEIRKWGDSGTSRNMTHMNSGSVKGAVTLIHMYRSSSRFRSAATAPSGFCSSACIQRTALLAKWQNLSRFPNTHHIIPWAYANSQIQSR